MNSSPRIWSAYHFYPYNWKTSRKQVRTDRSSLALASSYTAVFNGYTDEQTRLNLLNMISRDSADRLLWTSSN